MSRPRLGYQTYQDEMILTCQGFPVWFADPYGRAEIKIDDIGYMRWAPPSSVSLTASLFRKGMFEHVINCDFRFNELITTQSSLMVLFTPRASSDKKEAPRLKHRKPTISWWLYHLIFWLGLVWMVIFHWPHPAIRVPCWTWRKMLRTTPVALTLTRRL